MKKFFLALLLGGLIMAGTTGAQAAHAKTAVVYFSATGTTARMAKGAAQSLGADAIEIVPVHKYTDADLNWHDKKSLSTIECNDPKSRTASTSALTIPSSCAIRFGGRMHRKSCTRSLKARTGAAKSSSRSAHQAEADSAEAEATWRNTQKARRSKAAKTSRAKAART